jgi:hypothetical protein
VNKDRVVCENMECLAFEAISSTGERCPRISVRM